MVRVFSFNYPSFMFNRLLKLAGLLLVLLSSQSRGQRHESALSEAEVETLRDTAYVASDRVLAFVKFLDERSASIQEMATKPRKPGREQDIHDRYEQFTSIADELDDNLDDYAPKHRDLRKALPKLLAGADRWNTALKTPAPNDSYEVSRKLALEAVRDLRESAAHLIDEQKAYFLAHPPPKEDPAATENRRPR